MSLGTTVNQHKNGTLLAYIASRVPDIHLRKLLKIIYLIDERFTVSRGFPLTWFDYYAWEKGPVAPEVYAVKEGAFSHYVSARRNSEGKCVISPVKPHEFLVYKDMYEFSEAEISEIDRLLEEFADKTADELSDMTHVHDSLWSQAVAENNIAFDDNCHKSDCLIDLSRLFKEGDCRLEIYEDARWNMEFQAMLNQKPSNPDVPTA